MAAGDAGHHVHTGTQDRHRMGIHFTERGSPELQTAQGGQPTPEPWVSASAGQRDKDKRVSRLFTCQGWTPASGISQHCGQSEDPNSKHKAAQADPAHLKTGRAKAGKDTLVSPWTAQGKLM